MTATASRNAKAAWFTEQIKVNDRRRAELGDTLTDLMAELIDHPEDADINASVEATQTSIEAAERQYQRLLLSQAGFAKRQTAEARAELVAEHQANAAHIDRMGGELMVIGAKLLDAIEGMAPLLAKYSQISGERRNLARQVFADAGDPHLSSLQTFDTYRRSADLAEEVVAPAVAAMLYRIGLGRTGVQLDQWLTLSPPYWGGPFGRDADIPAAMRAQYARASDRLKAGLQKAINSMTEDGE